MFARLYFPCVPWLVAIYRAELRDGRIALHGALFASKHLARVRGRYHQEFQRDMFSWVHIGPRVKVIDELTGASMVTILLLTFYMTPVVVVGELANASMVRLGLAIALVLGCWLVTALVLVPIMSFSALWAQVTAFVLAVVFAAVVVGVFEGGPREVGVVRPLALGISWYAAAWLFGSDGDTKSAAAGRLRAFSFFVPLFPFAPFLTAELLIGPGYAGSDVLFAGLLSLASTSAIGAVVIFGVLRVVDPANILGFYGSLLLIVTALLVPITLVPRSPQWAVCAVRGAVLASGSGILAVVAMNLVFFAVNAFTGRIGVAKDPEVHVVRSLAFQILDLEFGDPAWWTLIAPERADERTGKRWVRRTLAARGRPGPIDREQERRLADRQDALIRLFDRYFAPRFRVYNEETNEYVRQQSRGMAATMTLWQRQILLRGNRTADVLLPQLVRALDAAVGREWDRFERTEIAVLPRRRRRRFLALFRQTVVAVLPLAAVAALVLSPLRLPDALIGSLVTFALTWLGANLLRAVDPSASESLDIADKLSRASRGG
ncbi:hypothetical protein [Amycolatopsis vancoresmycina]|uniref:Uncharacterized protein n=1 Tax=Amycolatopsis vancoresmycina DSM 44592 TaxID=1292037 RepID=R1IIT2_9PSEU|nr:hypothetical protein [Amycolatopsis vancoresmycina]EOD70329.1 hypothetical protein H480_01397 [Amycolatopsis vancoresmycina DSM 44592]